LYKSILKSTQSSDLHSDQYSSLSSAQQDYCCTRTAHASNPLGTFQKEAEFSQQSKLTN